MPESQMLKTEISNRKHLVQTNTLHLHIKHAQLNLYYRGGGYIFYSIYILHTIVSSYQTWLLVRGKIKLIIKKIHVNIYPNLISNFQFICLNHLRNE